jgi:aldehyde dehydrogenase (NAD+)
MTIQMTTDQTTEGGSAGVLAQVRTVFNTGRTRSVQWREEQLLAIERMCEEREAEISAALTKDLGRSAFEAWLGDIASTKAEAVFARKHFRKWMKPQRQSLPLAQMPGRAWVQYDPLGVVLVIGPWNYPFFLCMSPVVAAVSAGNAVVIKPSELAPATSELIARLVPLYLDREAVRVVEGAADATQDLLSQGFDHALFTGGTEIGRKIMAAAAATLTPVTLELGGKSPVLVLPDADIDVTARRIAWTKLLNSGQTCTALTRMIVPRSKLAEVEQIAAAAAAAFTPGNPFDSASRLGPLVSAAQRDRVRGFRPGRALLQCRSGRLAPQAASRQTPRSAAPARPASPRPARTSSR